MKGRWLQNLSLRQVGNELGDSPFRFANCPVTNHLDFGVTRQHGGQTEFALAFIKETQDGFADFFRNSNFVSYAQRRLGNFGDYCVSAGQPVEVSPVNLIVLELFSPSLPSPVEPCSVNTSACSERNSMISKYLSLSARPPRMEPAK